MATRHLPAIEKSIIWMVPVPLLKEQWNYELLINIILWCVLLILKNCTLTMSVNVISFYVRVDVWWKTINKHFLKWNWNVRILNFVSYLIFFKQILALQKELFSVFVGFLCYMSMWLYLRCKIQLRPFLILLVSWQS